MAEASWLADHLDDTVTQAGLEAALEAQTILLRSEMATQRAELRGEMADLRGRLRSEMAELHGELRHELAEHAAQQRRDLLMITGAQFFALASAVGVLVGLG